MPAFMPMILTNGHPPPPKVVLTKVMNLTPVPRMTAVDNLSRSMIARIHNAKPGCGSCGR
jgi:hypothetical protein